MAQLVARFLHTEEVVGSSPASPTRESPDLTRKRRIGAFVLLGKLAQSWRKPVSVPAREA
ncbi:hypothetical protein PSCLAVI8L_130300 [Pseudoclavibacter sp. 8L]|nr:hypothetical protein PSCLAVI8L_130300 [Pseudoclavibacter sp. 8L]